MKDKIPVTGGQGYTGSHTAVELPQINHKVVLPDNLSNSKLFIPDRIENITGIWPAFYQYEMSDKGLLQKVFAVEKTISCVIRYIIFSSSASVCGQPDHLPAYGSTKQTDEEILEKNAAGTVCKPVN